VTVLNLGGDTRRVGDDVRGDVNDRLSIITYPSTDNIVFPIPARKRAVGMNKNILIVVIFFCVGKNSMVKKPIINYLCLMSCFDVAGQGNKIPFLQHYFIRFKWVSLQVVIII
jgi:hypothetical protein